MRIVHYHNLAPKNPGGFIPTHRQLASNLRKYNCKLTFMTFSSGCDARFREGFGDEVEVEFIPTEHTKGIRLLVFLLRFIVSRRVDVLSMNFIGSWTGITLILLSRLLLRRTQFIYHKQSSGRIITNRYNMKKRINPLRVLSLLVAKVVCLSDSIVMNCLNRGVSARKVVRIYNSVVMEQFEGLRDTGKIRAEYGIPESHRIITTIKEARPETGLGDLLRSIPEVLAVFPETTFLIVGGGPETEGLKRLARELEIDSRVIFAGVRHDMSDVVAESYFSVNPSPVEAFGNVIIESMAGGKPVIAVRAWGPKEIIVDGETGILVDPGSPTQFAPAIVELLVSPGKVEAMGKASRERARDVFSVERRTSELTRVWVECLFSRGAHRRQSAPCAQ